MVYEDLLSLHGKETEHSYCYCTLESMAQPLSNLEIFSLTFDRHTYKEVSLTFDGALNCRGPGVKERVTPKGDS